jgi:hypothetical protein
MEAAAFLLLIIGCSEDLKHCTELPAPAPFYADAGECEGALPPELRRYGQRFPQVLAKCVAFDAALEEQDAELVWHIDPKGDLIATVEPVAANHTAAHRGEPL